MTCMPTVIEVLVTLMHDGYKQVSTSAQLALVGSPPRSVFVCVCMCLCVCVNNLH